MILVDNSFRFWWIHYWKSPYFHKNGKITRWRTFDQIIFSSAFLGHTEWHLNEDLTGILDIEKDLKIFDHFPVYGVIEKVQSHG